MAKVQATSSRVKCSGEIPAALRWIMAGNARPNFCKCWITTNKWIEYLKQWEKSFFFVVIYAVAAIMHGLKSYWDDNLIAHLRGLINLHHVPADFVGVISSLMESLCLLSLDPQHILRLLPEVSIIEFHYPVHCQFLNSLLVMHWVYSGMAINRLNDNSTPKCEN